MRKTREREKLLNALIFFSGNVNKVGKVKLFKLLYFLDFLHFEKTGKSVTGLQYYAWDLGPVPVELDREMKSPNKDFNDSIRKSKKSADGYTREVFEGRVPFDDKWFSAVELKLMQGLAKKHFNDNSKDMSDKSHFATGPWDEVFHVRGQKSARIPYELCLERRGNSRDLELLELAHEYEELRNNYG